MYFGACLVTSPDFIDEQIEVYKDEVFVILRYGWYYRSAVKLLKIKVVNLENGDFEC